MTVEDSADTMVVNLAANSVEMTAAMRVAPTAAMWAERRAGYLVAALVEKRVVLLGDSMVASMVAH